MILLSIIASLLGIILLITFGTYLLIERSVLPLKSTRAFAQVSRMPILNLMGGYFYAARPHLYLKPITWPFILRHLSGSETADNYHGKVITSKDASKIVQLNRPVHQSDLEQVIPFPVARSIILNDPLPALAVMECPCRAQKKNSCPRDVCMVVGEPFVSFVVEHSPEKARRISVEEALKIIEDEEKRGHIHTAWFKKEMHNRFYTICNCCSCCCLGMASYFRGVPRVIHSGYKPIIKEDDCIACGACESICPFRAIKMVKDSPVTDFDLCMGCGLCTSHCPVKAIDLSLDADRGIPLDIEKII